MIDFDHKKSGNEALVLQLFDLQVFMLGYQKKWKWDCLCGWIFTSIFEVYKNPTKKRTTWLFYGFSSQRKSRIFLPSQKPPKRSWWFYWPIWQVTTSGNLHISSINDQQESPLLTYFIANKVKPRCHLWQAEHILKVVW